MLIGDFMGPMEPATLISFGVGRLLNLIGKSSLENVFGVNVPLQLVTTCQGDPPFALTQERERFYQIWSKKTEYVKPARSDLNVISAQIKHMWQMDLKPK